MKAVDQKVFIARHGERADHVDHLWHRTAERPGDPPLTDTGLQQAHELGLRLKAENISHIYCSPFLRTVQTANEVAKVLNLPVKVEHGLSEGLLKKLFTYGAPQLLSLQQLNAEMSSVATQDTSIWQPVAFPEQYRDTKFRCTAVAMEILKQHPQENMLLVGHGLSVEYLASAIVKESVEVYDIPYCSLTECIRHGSTWTFGLMWNDDHLMNRQDREQVEEQRRLWGLGPNTA